MIKRRTDDYIKMNYQMIKVIGRGKLQSKNKQNLIGTFGEVAMARDKRTGKMIAIKKVVKSVLSKDKGKDKVQEYEILKKLVSFKDVTIFLVDTSSYCESA